MFTRVSSAVESVELKPCSSQSADQLKMGNSTQTGGGTTEPKDPEAPAAAAIKNNKMKKKGIRAFMKRTRRAISNTVLCCLRGDIAASDRLGVQTNTQDEVDHQPVDPSKLKNIKAPTIVISYPCSDSVDLQPCSSSQSGNKLSVSMDLPDSQPAPVSDSSNLSSVSESGSVQESSGLHLKPDSDLAESVLNGLVKSDISMSFWFALAFELTTVSDPISQEISISGLSSIETTPDVDPADPESLSLSDPDLTPVAGPSGIEPAVGESLDRDSVDLQPRSSSQSGIDLPVSMDMPDPQPAPVSDSSNLSSDSESGSVQESSSLETEPGSNPSVEEKPEMGQTELELSPVPGPSNLSSVSESGSVQESSSLETEPGSKPSVEEKPDMGQTELEPSLVPGLSNLSLVAESGSVPGPSSLETEPGSNPSVEEKPEMGQTELEPSPVPGPSNLSLVAESGSVPGPSSLETEPGSNPSVKKKHDRGQSELKPSHVPGTTGSFTSFYDWQEMLGRGACGSVYQAVRKSDGKMVAVKIVEKSYLDLFHVLPEYSRPLFFEVAVNLMLKKPPASPYIVKMLDWFEEPERHVMIMEYPHPCKTLQDFIKYKGGSLDETVARGLFRQAVLAVKHCVKRGIVHGDMKSDNVLVNTETMQLKLIDFGCSCLRIPEKHATHEALFLGCMLFEMVTGRNPIEVFIGPFPEQLMSSCNRPVSRVCHDLVRRCLSSNKSQRPTLGMILKDKWFNRG